jgi:hypothetical protein
MIFILDKKRTFIVRDHKGPKRKSAEMDTVRFDRRFLRSRLHKIWAAIPLALMSLASAPFLGPVPALIGMLASLCIYGALMLLTRCPKCGRPVLGVIGGSQHAAYAFPHGVPDKCPFCGHLVEAESATTV